MGDFCVRIYIDIQPEVYGAYFSAPRNGKLVRPSLANLAKRYCILYFAGLRMRARVDHQLHFFAYESKLRYMRDLPEGVVKYSR